MKGPPYHKVGGKVVYRYGSVQTWLREIQGLGQQGHPKVTITTRPYAKDITRQHVDVMFPHPHKPGQTYRKRIVAPRGMDATAAKMWGERQAHEILRGLIRDGFSKPANDAADEETAPTTKPTTTTRKAAPAPVRAKVPTLGDLWKEHEAAIANGNASNLRTVQSHWRQLAGILADVPVDCIDRAVCKKITAHFSSFSAPYLKHCMALVRNLLKIAREDEHIDRMPELPTKRAEKKPKEIAHGAEEIGRLLMAARDPALLSRFPGENLELTILLGIDAGLRPGEVAGLRWKDIDWAANQLIVQNQRPLAGNSDVIVKAGEAGRVSMTKRLRLALESHRHVGGVYVLTRGDMDPLYTNVIGARIMAIHETAGLQARRGHFMRHCAASRVILAGGDVSTAQAHLRHKLATTTQGYIHDVRGSAPAAAAAAILDSIDSPDAGMSGNGLAPGGNTRQIAA